MNPSSSQPSSRAVATWLLIGTGMIMIQVLLGGITRLTGSGLSITEWKPLLGTLPPLNEQDWQTAFEKYKQIGQYKHLNYDFTLSDFQFIYFWEWLHRLWARLMSVIFIIGFVYLLWKKYLHKEMIRPMLILFLLGALQGAIGWIMVQSGLNEEDIYVSHIRLAIHFVAALGLLVYTFWFALQLLVPAAQRVVQRPLKKFIIWLIILLVIQLIYGALMAGLKAATFAPTWPTINGEWWPAGMGKLPGLRDLTDNPITVQFIHRGIAYLLTILTIVWWWKANGIKSGAWFRKSRALPVVLILLQVLLGILTVIHSPRKDLLLWLGTAHQFVAMALLVNLVLILRLLSNKSFKQPL